MKDRISSRALATILCAAALGGCAQPGMYQWGEYDAMLYRSYKDPAKAADFREGLERHIGKMEGAHLKVAPGLYAELGTLYLQAGESDKAISMYTKEREAWPESKGLMNALISNVGKRPVPGGAMTKS